jgi:hypothetical protein
MPWLCPPAVTLRSWPRRTPRAQHPSRVSGNLRGGFLGHVGACEGPFGCAGDHVSVVLHQRDLHGVKHYPSPCLNLLARQRHSSS